MRRLAVLAALIAAVAGGAMLTASPARAAVSGHRWHAWTFAHSQQGSWYSYGSTGPYSAGYDCSGLVYRSYRRQGYSIPRTTYGMLGWWRLRRVTKAGARMGDLAFYGSGHVEMYAGRHWTFGAQQSGTRVGYHWISVYWHPSAYYHVRGAG